MKISYIAFYGTLMSGSETAVHELIKNSLAYEGNCLIPGKLYDLGRYPGLKTGRYPIEGELYKILSEDILSLLDRYEATDNEDASLPGFIRKPVLLMKPDKKEAWVYYYEGDVNQKPLLGTNRWN